jgi:hypothetical protein
MLAVLWHHRDVLVDAFWTHQTGEPPNVWRYYRIAAAVLVLPVAIWFGVGFWLDPGLRISK